MFLEGHVDLEAIYRVLLPLLNKNGILAVTIRDSFLNKNPEFKNKLNANGKDNLNANGKDNLNESKYKVIEFCEIQYLKNVKAWLVIFTSN